MIRRAPYNRQIILFGRWRVPYAPAFGWRHPFGWWLPLYLCHTCGMRAEACIPASEPCCTDCHHGGAIRHRAFFDAGHQDEGDDG